MLDKKSPKALAIMSEIVCCSHASQPAGSDQANDLIYLPNMVSDASFHRWRHPRGLMDVARIALHVRESQGNLSHEALGYSRPPMLFATLKGFRSGHRMPLWRFFPSQSGNRYSMWRFFPSESGEGHPLWSFIPSENGGERSEGVSSGSKMAVRSRSLFQTV